MAKKSVEEILKELKSTFILEVAELEQFYEGEIALIDSKELIKLYSDEEQDLTLWCNERAYECNEILQSYLRDELDALKKILNEILEELQSMKMNEEGYKYLKENGISENLQKASCLVKILSAKLKS